MSFRAIVCSCDDFSDVNLHETRTTWGDESSEPVSPSSHTLEEDHLVTVMQDSALDYVMIATDGIPDENSDSHVPGGVAVEEGVTEDDFVLISEDGPSDLWTGWWNTLQHYAYVATRKGGQWTNKLVDTTLNKLQPRTSGIHATYDWVSDTKVEGGRLILPGQLISWDDTSDLPLEGLKASSASTGRNESSSVIMVSAYDLLACQTSEGPDWTLRSRNTMTIPLALAKMAKQKTLHLARKVSNRVKASSATMKQQVKQVLSPPLASAAGVVHDCIEWCFPSHIEIAMGGRRTDMFSSTGRNVPNIELSTVMDIKHRLTVKEHTIR